MSDGFPKYYTARAGFSSNILYVVRCSPTVSRLIANDGTEKELHWDFMMDRFVADRDWIQVPNEVIESGNIYTFCRGLDKKGTAVICHKARQIAEVDEHGVFRFTVAATLENAGEFIAMIEEFLQRRVSAIDVSKEEPAITL